MVIGAGDERFRPGLLEGFGRGSSHLFDSVERFVGIGDGHVGTAPDTFGIAVVRLRHILPVIQLLGETTRV